MLKTIEEHNQEILKKLEEEKKKLYNTGVMCPKCSSELQYTKPYETLLSYPPKKEVKCSICDFRTTILCE